MPRRELERQFNRVLSESGFSFVPRGIHHIQEIYELVKNEFRELCDDEFKCKDCCSKGGQDPEWNHIVRSLFNGKHRVRKSPGRGNWEFYE
jgi:hypothetical protein